MPAKAPNLPDALLRLWLLAQIGLALLYLWQGWRLSPYPGDWAAPPVPRAVSVVKGLHLFLLVPAAITLAARWPRWRDWPLAVLALAFALLSAAALSAWGMATTLGAVRLLFLADAAIALLGAAAAWRAISLSA